MTGTGLTLFTRALSSYDDGGINRYVRLGYPVQ